MFCKADALIWCEVGFHAPKVFFSQQMRAFGNGYCKQGVDLAPLICYGLVRPVHGCTTVVRLFDK